MLKSYLRELPDPLLTSNLLNEWNEAGRYVDVFISVFILALFTDKYSAAVGSAERHRSEPLKMSSRDCRNRIVTIFVI